MNWGEPLDVANATIWRSWLCRNYESATEAFVLIYRKHCEIPGLKYDQAVEEALCFGWIDGIARTFDADRSLNRFTPRRPRSNWSESNRARVRRLAAAGRLEPAGLVVLPADLIAEIEYATDHQSLITNH